MLPTQIWLRRENLCWGRRKEKKKTIIGIWPLILSLACDRTLLGKPILIYTPHQNCCLIVMCDTSISFVHAILNQRCICVLCSISMDETKFAYRKITFGNRPQPKCVRFYYNIKYIYKCFSLAFVTKWQRAT